MESMNRSMYLVFTPRAHNAVARDRAHANGARGHCACRTGANAGAQSAQCPPYGSLWRKSRRVGKIACPGRRIIRAGLVSVPTHLARVGIARALQMQMTELRARNAHPTNRAPSVRRSSVRRLMLSERLFELLHDGVGIAAGLAYVVEPLLLQRFG